MAIVVPIVSSWDSRGLDKAVNEIKRAEGAFNKLSVANGILSASLIDTGKSLTRNLTVPLIGAAFAINKAVQGASDLNETITKTEAIFGSAAPELKKWAAGAATSMGMSQRAALDAAGTFGLFAKVAGLSGTAAANFAKDYTKLASDFASFYNTSPQDAIVAIGAALRGESEPIRRFNILLDEQTVKTRALKMGIIENISQALTPQQKVLARSAEIMAQSTVAQGDFERTSQGLANQQRILAAQTQNLSDTFGAVFLPVMLNIVRFIRENVLPTIQGIIAGFQALSPQAKSTALMIGLFAAALGPAMLMVGYFSKALGFLGDMFKFVFSRAFLIPTVIITILAAIVKGLDSTKSFGDAVYTVIRGLLIAFVQIGNAALEVINIFIRGYNLFARVTGRDTVKHLSFDFLIRGLDGAKTAFGNFSSAMSATQQDMSQMAAEARLLSEQVGAESNPNSVAGSTKKASDATAEFKKRLEEAKNTLQEAKNKFAEFASSVSGSIKSIINFSSAASAETGGFVENLVLQAEQSKAFAERIRRLIQMGLSESALKQVLDAGLEAGTKIADEIIAGGATIVDQVNTILAATQSLADEIGNVGAEQFYGAGVKQGEALVQGVLDAMKAAGLSLDSEGNIVGASVPTIGAPSAGVTPAAPAASGTQQQVLPKRDPLDLQASRIANKLSRITPRMAAGGIVTGPTLATIGEAGPEAVIPLGRSRGVMGNTYNLTINAGMGVDGQALGKQIVDAIKRYERSSGPVFASA